MEAKIWSSFGTRLKLHLEKTLHFGTTPRKNRNSHDLAWKEGSNFSRFLRVCRRSKSFGVKLENFSISSRIVRGKMTKLFFEGLWFSHAGVGFAFTPLLNFNSRVSVWLEVSGISLVYTLKFHGEKKSDVLLNPARFAKLKESFGLAFTKLFFERFEKS
jgi:hypothetical protein